MSLNSGTSRVVFSVLIATIVLLSAAAFTLWIPKPGGGGSGTPESTAVAVPGGGIEEAGFNLTSFISYAELAEFLEKVALASYYKGPVFLAGEVVAMPEASEVTVTVATMTQVASQPVPPPVPGVRGSYYYSQTNVQVEGVDEADLIKLFPPYMALVTKNKVYVVEAYPAEGMEVKSVIELKEDRQPIGVYVANNSLVVLSSSWGWVRPLPSPPLVPPPAEVITTEVEEEGTPTTSPAGKPKEANLTIVPPPAGITEIQVYDLSDPGEPRLRYSINVTGNYVTSRYLKGYVYVVVNAPAYRVEDKLGVPEVNGEPIPPEEIRRLGEGGFEGFMMYTIVLAFNVVSGEYSYDAYLMNPASYIYVSRENLYILSTVHEPFALELKVIEAVMDYMPEDLREEVSKLIKDLVYPQIFEALRLIEKWFNSLEKSEQEEVISEVISEVRGITLVETEIFKFRLEALEVVPIARGSVPGYLLDQFSMDEYKGYFRVATTSEVISGLKLMGGAAIERQNNVYVLNEELEVVGKLEGLAVGERIYSARYLGDLMYLVTFRQVDPLFGIDLSDPENPKVIGYLKIPGFSEYLHPYGNYLIGVGMQADEQGRVTGFKVSVFNVSDPSNITEVSSFVMEGNVYSEVLRNHRAFVINYREGYIMIPISGYLREGKYVGKLLEGILVLKIGEDGKLELLGILEHEGAFRSAFINEVIYSVGHLSIKAFKYPELEFINEVKLS